MTSKHDDGHMRGWQQTTNIGYSPSTRPFPLGIGFQIYPVSLQEMREGS